MRSTKLMVSLACILSLSSLYTFGQTMRTVYIDAANNNGPASWNNLAFTAAGNTAFLKDSLTVNTGIRATVTVALNPGTNTQGTTAPTGDAAEFAPAGGNSAYGHADASWGDIAAPLLYGEVAFSNLNPTVAYSFTFFASRMNSGEIRDTRYTVTGANSGTDVLDAANNTANVVTIANILPTSDGTITLRLEEGPANTEPHGFFYIGAMKITYLDPGEVAGKRLLFFGNSFSLGGDVPGKVASLALIAGHPTPLVVSDLLSGADLAAHISAVDSAPADNVANALLTGANT